MKNETKFKDAIHHSTNIKVDFWSLVRMMFGKAMYYKVVIKTENEVGANYVSEQLVNVPLLFPKKLKHGGGMISMPECPSKIPEPTSNS